MNTHHNRRTFAIISHPDAGKTTLTEQLLLHGGAVNLAGTVKGRKAARHATSDWLALEKERGISVTTSVMQFPYKACVFNLLDTPGHADFSEDTYRTLSAVDAAIMVIDVAKGVEDRTRKLMDVCRVRQTPVITFINKCDRHGQNPLTLLESIEEALDLQTLPQVWPIGAGQSFYGNYVPDRGIMRFESMTSTERREVIWVSHEHALKDAELDQDAYSEAMEEWSLVEQPVTQQHQRAFEQGKLTPVFFGSALKSFAIETLMDALVTWAPAPQKAPTLGRDVEASETPVTGFVFKIQANMDPKHRDRMAFMRLCSGHYQPGCKLHQVRTGKTLTISHAQTFMAESRSSVEEAFAGDIIGIHNHGGIRVGDSFTQGEALSFIGIPFFAPELFKRVRLKDPLKQKALLKGLIQLAEEGATQFFRTQIGGDYIVGAIGILQFDVVAYRLKREYQVDCAFDAMPLQTARWLQGDPNHLDDFQQQNPQHCATDSHDKLVYLAPSRVHLQLTQDRWPKIHFLSTFEMTD